MSITFTSEDIPFPALKMRKTASWIKQVAESHEKIIGDINYLFCTDERILAVNNQYLEHDYYTDIITFDYSENETLSGDIFISIDTVLFNANDLAIDYLRELYRIIIHGILHLCGQDDKTEGSRAEMTAKENAALEILQTEFI